MELERFIQRKDVIGRATALMIVFLIVAGIIRIRRR